MIEYGMMINIQNDIVKIGAKNDNIFGFYYFRNLNPYVIIAINKAYPPMILKLIGIILDI